MKLALLFLFAILTPFTVFLTEVLHGGTSPEELKKGLDSSPMYTNISEFIITTESDEAQDPEAAKVSMQIYKQFTPEYIKSKTEKLIDDSHIWITAEGPSPVLSFTEIKQNVTATNPQLLAQLEQIQTEYAAQQKEFSAESSLAEYAGDASAQSETDALTALAQNNFSVPVGEYFQGIKGFYSLIKILQPILIVILFITLFLLVKQNHTLSDKLKWLGLTLITAAVFGFGMVVFNTLAIEHLMQATVSSPDNFLAAFAPIMLQLMDTFMTNYATIQNIVGICMLLTGVLCFVGAKLNKSKV